LILNVEKKSVKQKVWKNDDLEKPEIGFEPVSPGKTNVKLFFVFFSEPGHYGGHYPTPLTYLALNFV
jgi:hypothetical protein